MVADPVSVSLPGEAMPGILAATRSPLVVIGASAGGIEALATLLATLPTDFPAPIVVAQHLDPTRQSQLAPVLGRHSTLPIHTVEEHETLRPGVVFVVPANRHVEISDHDVRVYTGGPQRPKPSVDLLLASAARTYGERLIAVILTGTGVDGTAGARDVKQHDGAVVIQNPATAAFAGMPGSLVPTTVDVVAELADIGARVYDLLTGRDTAFPRADDPALPGLLARVLEDSGLDGERYDGTTMLRRLHRRMVACGTRTPAAYLEHLERHPEELRRLVSALLARASELLSDPELFAHLREVMMPPLLTQATGRAGGLRLWASGCGTDEDAYSLALVVADLLGAQADHPDIRIFAADLDADAVAFARRGIYPASAIADVPPDVLARHFTEVTRGYRVSERIRSMVVFGLHDLARGPPFPHLDLILCRGVLQYYARAAQQRALRLFASSLRDDGYLVLGRAEAPSADGEFYDAVAPHLGVYRRRAGRAVLAPSSGSHQRQPAPGPTVSGHAAAFDLEGLVAGLSSGVIVVDRRYDVQLMNAAAVRLLGLLRPSFGQDLLHLLPSALAQPLRVAIDAALHGESSPPSPALPLSGTDGSPRFIQFRCGLVPTLDPLGPVEYASIEVADATALEALRAGNAQRDADLAAAQRASAAAAERQQEELAREVTRRQALLRERRALAAANAQLVQDILASRTVRDAGALDLQEAQASAQEAQTLSEDLRAALQEVTIRNEELRAVIEARRQERRETVSEAPLGTST